MLEKETKMVRIARGIQEDEKWDRVKLTNGMIGYIAQGYVEEIGEIPIERIEITANKTTFIKGEEGKIDANIFPFEARGKKVEYLSSHPEVAIVDSQGRVQTLSSGKTTITVKAVESEVEASITISVYNPVKKIEVMPQKIYVSEGEKVKCEVSVFPKDADDLQVTMQSQDEEIAKVTEEGEILGCRQGNTKIIVKAKESNVQTEVEVEVGRKIEEGEISFVEPYMPKDWLLTGIIPKENKVWQIKEKIKTGYEIRILDFRGNILEKEELVGTGSKIQILEQGTVLREYTAILYGDADGNGKIDSVDLLVIQRHILELQTMDFVFQKASNIRKNGKEPTALDLLFIQRDILEIEKIKQR